MVGSFGWLLSGGGRRLRQGGGRWLLEVPFGFGSLFVFWALTVGLTPCTWAFRSLLSLVAFHFAFIVLSEP